MHTSVHFALKVQNEAREVLLTAQKFYKSICVFYSLANKI